MPWLVVMRASGADAAWWVSPPEPTTVFGPRAALLEEGMRCPAKERMGPLNAGAGKWSRSVGPKSSFGQPSSRPSRLEEQEQLDGWCHLLSRGRLVPSASQMGGNPHLRLANVLFPAWSQCLLVAHPRRH